MAKIRFAQFLLQREELTGWVKVDLQQDKVLAVQDGPWTGVPEEQALAEEWAENAIVELVKAPPKPSRPASQGGTEGAGGPAEGSDLKVTASMTDEEVIALASKGELLFDSDDFRELDGRVLDKLNRLSLDRYVIELQVYRKRLAREAHENEYGPSLRVEVMGDNALGRLKVEGLDRKWHHYWELPENVHARKKMGYVTVDGRFPEVHAGDKSASGTHHVHRSDGTVELVLMACPKEDAQARLQAQADESAARTGRTKAQLEAAVAQATGQNLPTSMQTKPSEKVRVIKTAE